MGGIEVAADPVGDIAVYARAELERIYGASKTFVPS